MPRLINKHMDHPDVVACIARRCAKSVIQEWCSEAMDIISSQTFDSEVVDAETVVKLREQMRKSRDCRKVAKAALEQWYHQAFCDAEEQIAKVQLEPPQKLMIRDSTLTTRPKHKTNLKLEKPKFQSGLTQLLQTSKSID